MPRVTRATILRSPPGLGRAVALGFALASLAACGGLLGLDEDWVERGGGSGGTSGHAPGGHGGATTTGAGGHGGATTTSAGGHGGATTTSAGGAGGHGGATTTGAGGHGGATTTGAGGHGGATTTSAGGHGGATTTSAGGHGGATTTGAGGGLQTVGPVGWIRALDDAQGSVGAVLATDVAGDVLVAGNYTGTLDCGDGKTHGSKGAGGLFVAKLRGTNGDVLWCKSYAGTGSVVGLSIATGPQGSVALGGFIGGSVQFGAQLLLPDVGGVTTAFVAKLDAGGNESWGTTFGPGAVSGVVIDSQDRVVIAMSVVGSTMPFTGAPVAGASDALVAGLAADGQSAPWTLPITGADAQYAGNLARDASGDLYLVASTNGLTEVAGDTFAGPGAPSGANGVVMKLGPSGAFAWKQLVIAPLGGAAPVADGMYGPLWPLAVTASGELCVGATLSTDGKVAFGGSLLAGAKGDGALACLSTTDGAPKFATRFVGDAPTPVTGLAARAPSPPNAARLVVAGSTIGTIDFGGGVGLAAMPQGYLGLFGEAGTPFAAAGAPGVATFRSQSAATVPPNLVAFTGRFAGSIQWGAADLHSSSPTTAFVAVVPF
jgi:hypothetical protein